MPQRNGRIGWGIFFCLALLFIGLVLYVVGPGLSGRLGVYFALKAAPPTVAPSSGGSAGEAAAEDDADSSATEFVENAFRFLLDLCEFHNPAWWARLFQGLAIGAFGLALAIALVVTHAWVARGAPPLTPKPPAAPPKDEDAWP